MLAMYISCCLLHVPSRWAPSFPVEYGLYIKLTMQHANFIHDSNATLLRTTMDCVAYKVQPRNIMQEIESFLSLTRIVKYYATGR